MKILLGDLNKMLGKRLFLNLPCQHYDSSDNGVRIVKLYTSKDLVVKSTMFPHPNIHNYTWNCPDGNNNKQIDHILIDIRHSCTLDARSFRGSGCDTVQYLVVAKVRERPAVSKRAAEKFHVQRFNFCKLNELEVRKQYQIEITGRFEALHILNDSEDINRAWENIQEDFNNSAKDSIGLHELKQHKTWFDEESLSFQIKVRRSKCSDYRIQTTKI
jgi:hypothetical protein